MSIINRVFTKINEVSNSTYMKLFTDDDSREFNDRFWHWEKVMFAG